MNNIVSFLLIMLAFDISSNAQNVDLSSVDEFLNIVKAVMLDIFRCSYSLFLYLSCTSLVPHKNKRALTL